MSTLSVPPERSDPVGAQPMQEEIHRLLLRQHQALRAGNAALSALLGSACERLAGEVSSRGDLDLSELPRRVSLVRQAAPRETQADFGDFAR